jgi:hypothetical protein
VRLRLAALCVAALALPTSAGAVRGLHFSFSAPTHTPRVNAKWFYSVHATLNGKPVRATVTSQIVDPVGGVHPVQFRNSKRNVTNHPFVGVFRDYVQFPPEAQGVRLTLRVTVKARGARIVFPYWIEPR